jgi:predicted ester cyclase
MSTKTESNIATVLKLAEVFSRNRPDMLGDILHPAYFDGDAPPGRQDAAGFAQIIAFWHSSFSAFGVQIVHVFGDGEWVGMLDRTTGVHDKGPAFGVPANGRVLAFEANHIFRFSEGKIREHWVKTNLATALEQLAKG